ncbi:Tetratricopeptide repeat protein 15 [Termitomyces sp. T112]|nr:Tetratricopeptide repeat protein 15 [Termitomyces sp. T112]
MSSPTESPKTSPGKKIKQLPMKLGRKIKHQLHRISSMGHVRQHLQEAITSISPLIHPIDRPRRSSVPISPPASSKTDYSRLSLRSTKGAEFSRHTDSQDSLVSSRHSMDGSTPRQEKQIQSTSADELVSEPASELVVEDSVEQPGLDDTGEPRQTVLPEEPTFLTSVVHVELGIPDPFLVDDDTSSEEEAAVNDPAPPSQSVTSNEVPLALPPSPRDFEPPMALTVGLLSTNVNKAVPPLPADSETDEDEAPDLYLPGLLLPTMFLPIPNTDPLTILLTKYIYPPEKRPVRDVTGDWQRSDFHTLVMTNSWRALARMARDRLVAADPEDLTLVLGLWYLRLACLARLRLFNQASAECNNLFVVLNAIEPLDAREWVFSRILPFELEVINARVKYWAGDHMGHLDVLIALLRKCRSKARQEKGNEVAVAMWKERGARVCLIIASQLVEMKDYRAAVKLLEPLCEQGETSTAALRSSIGRIYLQSGEIQTAVKHFEIVSADPLAAQELKDMNAGLLACAEGDWPRASSLFTESIARDTNDFVAVNNLAVALLGQGKLQEGIDVLETALKASPLSVVVTEPFLFNLCKFLD